MFALLFLEFGLSLAQFSISNLIWAVAIVSLEVPSGALADIVGRKKLVVLAALLMIMEMAVLLLAQPHSGNSLLMFFCLNRFLSGAGEAMASGADEALAYDSLVESGDEGRWSEVLEWQTRLSSIAFFIVMLSGAAVYDPSVVNAVGGYVGWDLALSKADTLKLPIWLTLGSAALALLAALALRPNDGEDQTHESSPWSKVREVGVKIAKTRQILVVVLAAVLFDQAARASMTMSSQTFAAYGIAEVWFGVIGAAMALSGALISKPARLLADYGNRSLVFWLMIGLSMLGLLGQAANHGVYGLFFVLLLSIVMSLNGFFASFYLNQMSSSKERATLLSFKGLLCNVGFGVISLYYSGVTSVWAADTGKRYLDSLFSLPIYFAVCAVLFLLYCSVRPIGESSSRGAARREASKNSE